MTELPAEIKEWLTHYNFLLSIAYEKGNLFTPENIREGFATLTRTMVTDTPEISMVTDDAVDGGSRPVPVRIYHPAAGSPLPVLVFFHGGGHMAGSVKVYDPICRKIALATMRIVVSVEYRLAPEYPYPAGIEDGQDVINGCFAMLDRLQINHLPRLALAGDSAGGAICATLAHRNQFSGGAAVIKHLVLIYPSLDYTLSCPSVERLSSGYLLEKERIEWYFDHYFQNNESRTEASPLFMKILDSFPETMVITAGFCPLCDEAIEYVQKLKARDIPVQHLHFDGMLHAFLNMENLASNSCEKLYHEVGCFLR
jgi:acetyl esterase